MAAWIIRGYGMNDITETNAAYWFSVPPWVVFVTLSIWVWEAYRRYRNYADLYGIRDICTYIQIPDKGHPSLSKYHAHKTLRPPTEHSGPVHRIL